jgi:AGZA family xanthine/uracil permease-like MFS transporter
VRYPWFVRGDVDGFFGLFIDNLLQLMLIGILCTGPVGLPAALVYGRILPGAALSILAGNLYYAWQARQAAMKTGRPETTALPYGINTVSLFAFIFLIMAPIYQETKNATLAWQAGLFASLASAFFEMAGAFLGDWLRRNTPRAALLAALAGIAITFIAMGFVFQIFAAPSIALIPMFLILLTYASRSRLPLGLPGGFAAVLLGLALTYGLRVLGHSHFEPGSAALDFGFHAPAPAVSDMLAFLGNGQGWKYLSVILPMSLFNVLGSLQNLESAEAAGDRFETRPSLLVNGACSLVAAFFGSPFPTTIYIGHPGWKAMGARWGYSILNGAVVALLCLVGGVTLVLNFVPLEVTLGILLWVGIIITAQAFEEVPKRHGLAVALGLIPSLAAWALLLIQTTLQKAGAGFTETFPKFGSDLFLGGVVSLSQGFMLSSMVLAAMLALAVERRFKAAAGWGLAGAGLSFFGLMHAYTLGPAGVQNQFGWNVAPGFTGGYLGAGLVCLWLASIHSGGEAPIPEAPVSAPLGAVGRVRHSKKPSRKP